MADFLHGVPREIHLAHLQRERDSGGAWTDAAARVCVLLDLDRARVRDFAAYGRQWRWNVASRGPNAGRATDETGRNAVRRAWPSIVGDVLTWITYGGTSTKSPLLANVPEDWWQHVDFRPADDRATTGKRPADDRENAESVAESKVDDRQTTARRPANDRLTRSDPDTRPRRGDTPPTPRALAVAGDFEAFWTAYPKKRGKKAAETAYARAVRGSPDLPARLLTDVEARKLTDDRWRRGFVPDPATYLNQERWNDELTEPSRTNGRSLSPARAAADINPAEAYARIREAVRGAAG